ncbi:hypothetical protein M378DRAFT_172059 [Amanita muscaria Koide BX008]|uniref:Uncharacterized protein n=1 Tax=Amanita muscaria (strain Koide BX008) TaxID=946122 RepID=A0A0C2WKD9_AMAMK|nr:hypothetical protein M378DRAFT_172059 [Amanita muscaria Koide BX008]
MCRQLYARNYAQMSDDRRALFEFVHVVGAVHCRGHRTGRITDLLNKWKLAASNDKKGSG